MGAHSADIESLKSSFAELGGSQSIDFTDPTSNTIEIKISDYEGTVATQSLVNSKLNMLVPGYTFIKEYKIHRNVMYITVSKTP